MGLILRLWDSNLATRRELLRKEFRRSPQNQSRNDLTRCAVSDINCHPSIHQSNLKDESTTRLGAKELLVLRMIMRDISSIYALQLSNIVCFPTLAEHEDSADQESKNRCASHHEPQLAGYWVATRNAAKSTFPTALPHFCSIKRLEAKNQRQYKYNHITLGGTGLEC